jgi:protein transport protein SEC23
MAPVITGTGGFFVACETWSDDRLGKSILKFLQVFENSAGEFRISANFSKQFKISGCVGPCVSVVRPQADLVSEVAIGEGGTIEWKTSAVLPSTTFAFFFDVTATKAQPIRIGTVSFIQFISRYQHAATGRTTIRVTTSHIKFADLGTTKGEIGAGFDQEAASVLVAKLSMWKVLREAAIEVIRWADRLLIQFCRLFGTYIAGQPSTFSLDGRFAFLPQFLYHLRRSHFLTTFNSTPDQTSVSRHALFAEDVMNSMFMVQPSLMKFAIAADPVPVLLDTASIQPDVVLVLDTFFRVVVWHGATVARWRDDGHHQQEGLKVLLETPRQEAEELVAERFPTPALVSCDQGSSLARYLLTRCSPSEAACGFGETMATDEPSLDTFRTKLKQMAVATG